MDRNYVVPLGLGVVVLALVSWMVGLTSELQGLKDEIRGLESLVPDDSWQPEPGDLSLVGEPEFSVSILKDDPVLHGEVEWKLRWQFDVENNYHEDLLVFLEMEYECDTDTVTSCPNYWAKGGNRWIEGWTRFLDLDKRDKPNVVLVPSGGRKTVGPWGISMRTDSEELFPQAAWTIHGTIRLEHDNLQHTFRWKLGEGILNQSEIAIRDF